MEKIQAFLDRLESPEWHKRKAAISGLLGCPEDSYLPFLEAAIKDHGNATLRNAAMEFYGAMGGRALPSLLKLLMDPDEEARLFSANLLGEIKDSGAVGPLIDALKDPDVNVRIASAEALGRVGSENAFDAPLGAIVVTALAALTDDEPWVAQAAINAIGEIGGESALSVLHSCLGREDCRGMAFGAIEKAGDQSSIRLLTPFVDLEDVRELALKAIVGISEKSNVKPMPSYFSNILPSLIGLQKSPLPEIRKAALIALSWSQETRAIPCLVDALGDEELQEYAVAGLMSIGKKAAPSVTDALKDAARPNRWVMAKLLSMLGEQMALMQFASDDDAEVRVEAALALGRIPSERSVVLLSGMLGDPEDEVRAAAGRALETLNRTI